MNNELKYVAVVTCNGYNDFVSPFCNTALEVDTWCKEHGKQFDAVIETINHFELRNDFGYFGGGEQMKPELAPCPFCGAINTDVGFVEHKRGCYMMRKYMNDPKELLVEAWNTRVDTKTDAELIKRLIAKNDALEDIVRTGSDITEAFWNNKTDLLRRLTISYNSKVASLHIADRIISRADENTY